MVSKFLLLLAAGSAASVSATVQRLRRSTSLPDYVDAVGLADAVSSWDEDEQTENTRVTEKLAIASSNTVETPNAETTNSSKKVAAIAMTPADRSRMQWEARGLADALSNFDDIAKDSEDTKKAAKAAAVTAMHIERPNRNNRNDNQTHTATAKITSEHTADPNHTPRATPPQRRPTRSNRSSQDPLTKHPNTVSVRVGSKLNDTDSSSTNVIRVTVKASMGNMMLNNATLNSSVKTVTLKATSNKATLSSNKTKAKHSVKHHAAASNMSNASHSINVVHLVGKFTVNDKISINGNPVAEGATISSVLGCNTAPRDSTSITVCGCGVKVQANLLTECQQYGPYSKQIGQCNCENPACETKALESGYTETFEWKAASYRVSAC